MTVRRSRISMPKAGKRDTRRVSVVEASNRDKIVLDTPSGVVVVDRVRPPSFYIGGLDGIRITEYDARGIQSQVARGDLSAEAANALEIVDESGGMFVFREDGALLDTPRGYDTLSKLVLEVLKTKTPRA